MCPQTKKRYPECTAKGCTQIAVVEGLCRYCHPAVAPLLWENIQKAKNAEIDDRIAEAKKTPPEDWQCTHFLRRQMRWCRHARKIGGFCDIHHPVKGPEITARCRNRTNGRTKTTDH